MQFKSLSVNSRRASAVCGIPILLILGSANAFSQAPMAQMAQAAPTSADSADQNKQLADQVTELRAQVARLESSVQKTGPGRRTSPRSGMKMAAASPKAIGMTDDSGEMGMPPKAGMPMKDDEGEMGGNSPMAMGDDKDEMAMPMGAKNRMSAAPAAAMGMCCMGEMGSGGNGTGSPMAGMGGPSSATPGQTGASHLFHIGSKGFFLNHSQHITLTAEQRSTLNHLKEKAMLERASEQRKIDQSEQEMYILTSADQLDNSKVQAKVVEIEKLRAEQRMNFIRAVSDASIVLTHEQHLALLGTMAKK